MHHSLYSDYIDLSSIDLADRTYHFDPSQVTVPDDALIASIRQFGILHPPVVQKKGNHLIIIAGRKRILAARQLGIESILCLLVPEETEEREIYLLLVEETGYGRQLSLVEQACLFERLLQKMALEEVLPLLEKFGHKPQKYILEELLTLLSLGQEALTAVHLGKIPFRNALKMQRLSAENQEVAVHFITSLNLGGSKQSKLLDYCTELVMRTNIPLRQLLDKFIAGDTEKSDDNIPQKTGALLMLLHKQCFPRTAEAEKEFRKSVADLNLPNYVHLGHSPSFEEETVTMTVRLSDMETARQLLPEILKITKKQGIQ